MAGVVKFVKREMLVGTTQLIQIIGRTRSFWSLACHIWTSIYFLEQKVYVSSESHVFIPSFLSQAMRGCSTYTLPYFFIN